MTDLTYTQDNMFTTFYAETKAGEDVWNQAAAQMNGVFKVLNFQLDTVLYDIRKAGYTVRKAKKQNVDIDSLLIELEA